MYANVLKFHILIPHEKIGDPYFFLIPIISYFRVISLWKNNFKISYICSVVTVMGKQCSWGHSVLQTPALVSENALLSLPFSPKMFEVTKNCNFFPRSLHLHRVCKSQINLIWAAMMWKFIKYFFFICNSFLWTFILLFSFHGNVVIVQRKLCLLIISFSKSESIKNVPSNPTFHDWNSFFCPTFSKFWALLYPYFFWWSTWKPANRFLYMHTFIVNKEIKHTWQKNDGETWNTLYWF